MLKTEIWRGTFNPQAHIWSIADGRKLGGGGELNIIPFICRLY